MLSEESNIFGGNSDKSLHEILISEMDIKTLTYGEIVEKYVTKHGCDKRTQIILLKLGKYRNAITHFGADIRDDEDDFYALVYNSFDVILYVIYDELLKIDDFFLIMMSVIALKVGLKAQKII